MANILPEVQPFVTSMPSKGYDLQTGGSARRSFIKNTDDTYFIHGVPGHTHNASAMISVTAEYSLKRESTSTINTSWANAVVTLEDDNYTDSIDLRDRDERFDRAIERGIGRIIMIPENTNHMIEEPVRSISEIRTIVSPKDQLKTLTYVSNVHGDGWVDPDTGTAHSAFNRDDPVMVNFYSYEGVPRLEQNAAGHGTMRQPVYVANPNVNTIRYAIAGPGSSDPGGVNLWDGNVPFYWDEESRRYVSDRFSMYFPAYKLPSTVQGQAVVFTGAAGAHVTRQNFKVEFDSYETSKARDGYCVFSEHDSLVVTTSTATTGQDLIAKLPVQVVHPGIEMFSLAYWYGPPAFRIPVGAPARCKDRNGRAYARAIPGPPRQQANSFAGTYDDQNTNTQASCVPFFQILDTVTSLAHQAREYSTVFTSRIAHLKAQDGILNQVAPGNPAQAATNDVALKAAIWLNYLRPFGYGEAMHPPAGITKRSARHGFSSMLKYENSPYLRLNGLYAPDKFDNNTNYSDYTSDGVIPYPFEPPVLTATGNNNADVTVDVTNAQYPRGQNINHLTAMFPEEELNELRRKIDPQAIEASITQPVAWDNLDRQLFYGGFLMQTIFSPPHGDKTELTWQVTQPNEVAPGLFLNPQPAQNVVPVNPWDGIPQGGGSVDHQNFVFRRLYRTFAQFKKNPSNILNNTILNDAEFKQFHLNRVGAPAVSIRFQHTTAAVPPVIHRMQTFPFRILCHQTSTTVSAGAFFSEFKTKIATLLDSTSTMHQGLTDTTSNPAGNTIDAIDWEIDTILDVSRNILGTQAAAQGVYPYVETAHPKYLPFCHNAIGNVFEIKNWAFVDANANIELRDIYWEPSEFTNSDGVPNIVLLFNNYGITYDAQQAPRAYHLTTNDGVTGVYNRAQGSTPAAFSLALTTNDQDLAATGGGIGYGNGFNRVSMKIPLANFKWVDAAGAADTLNHAKFVLYSETQHPPGTPSVAIFVPGKSHSERFHDNNYELFRVASAERGKVFRNDVRISQHLCSPVLNPDMRLNCIAPLNHASRHLPPEMRDFQLLLRDVDFSFLKATSPPVLGDLVLSEFNGGIQQVAAQESLLYLPNFIEFKTSVQDDMTFSVDCMTGKGVPGYLCIFCRDSDELLEQPIIKRLSLQNLTTMKKSDSVIDTDVHELYHMTQRNVHPRSEYDSKAFNKRQTLLLAIEDIGIMGMDAKHYQRQKRVQVRVSGLCTNEGTVTVIFIYNNRGLFVKGRQQSVVHM